MAESSFRISLFSRSTAAGVDEVADEGWLFSPHAVASAATTRTDRTRVNIRGLRFGVGSRSMPARIGQSDAMPGGNGWAQAGRSLRRVVLGQGVHDATA